MTGRCVLIGQNTFILILTTLVSIAVAKAVSLRNAYEKVRFFEQRQLQVIQ